MQSDGSDSVLHEPCELLGAETDDGSPFVSALLCQQLYVCFFYCAFWTCTVRDCLPIYGIDALTERLGMHIHSRLSPNTLDEQDTADEHRFVVGEVLVVFPNEVVKTGGAVFRIFRGSVFSGLL